jgi:glycosyltransferase involved in cell wall biosynthesis
MCEVSVCMPTYNGERFIRDSIESVFSQDFEDYELIIIDDASTDSTLDIIHSFNDSRLRLYQNQASLGIPGNWNLCLTKIRGRYVKYLCQDDILYHDCISTMMGTFRMNETVGISFSRRDLLIEDGISVRDLYVHMKDLQKPLERKGKMASFLSGRELLESCIKYGGLFFNFFAEPSFVMFDSKWLARTGYFDNRLRQNVDYGYWLRFLLVADVSFIERSLGAFRIHKKSESFGGNIPLMKLRVLWEEQVVIEGLRTMAMREGAEDIASSLENRQKWYLSHRFLFMLQQRLEKFF